MRPGAFGRAALGAAAIALAACGSGQTRLGSVFATKWSDDDAGERLTRLVGELREVPINAGADVAVGVTRERLSGVPLEGGGVWHFDHPIEARPVLTGRVVVGAGGGEIFCLRAASGERLWARPIGGMRLLGAADDGQTTVATFASRSGVGYVLLAVDRDGSVVRQLETEEPLGSPTVVGNMVFLPWGQRFVTAYDLMRGEEVARVELPTEASHAFTAGGALYFGEQGLVRFDAALVRDGAHAPVTFLPKHELWGSMPWLRPASEPRDPSASLTDRVRAYARAASYGKPPGIADDASYATYGRLAFGLRPSTGVLRWVYTHDERLLGGAAFDGGIALCDAAGRVVLLEREGGLVVATLQLGAAVGSCVVQADGLRHAPSGQPAPAFEEQALRALLLNDPELAPAQRLLLRELAASPSADTTGLLLALAQYPARSDALDVDLDAAIASRRGGAAHLIEALLPPPEGAGPTRPASVGAIADALAAIGANEAAGPLARRLGDPNLPPLAARRVAAALVTLAGPPEYAELEDFFSLYRCDVDPELTVAVLDVARALVRVGGAKGRELVTQAVHDPFTSAAVGEGLATLLAALPPSAPEPKAAPYKKETPTLK